MGETVLDFLRRRSIEEWHKADCAQSPQMAVTRRRIAQAFDAKIRETLALDGARPRRVDGGA